MTEQPITENEVSLEPTARSKRTGLIVAFAVILALLGLLAWGLRKVQAGPVESGMAPDFTLTSFDGRTLTLSELRGQVVIINFWASWCPPCREEAAYLEQTWRKYEDQGVIFIGVDWVDTEKEALAYMDEFDLTYFNGPDIGTRIAQAYNIQGVPKHFILPRMVNCCVGSILGTKVARA
jgi:cytochrome c biogenesis protein CcmG/thiol:disulfide interchange protein DsbE